MTTVLLPLALTGCSLLGIELPGLPWEDDEPIDTATVSDTGSVEPRFDQLGDCGMAPAPGASAVGREIDLGDGFDATDLAARPPGYEVFDFSDDWRGFVVARGGTFRADTVDFIDEAVVFAWVSASSTCGLGLVAWDATQSGDDVHVDLEFEDESRNCLEVCDMEGVDWVALAVPLGSGPTVCHRVGGGC